MTLERKAALLGVAGGLLVALLAVACFSPCFAQAGKALTQRTHDAAPLTICSSLYKMPAVVNQAFLYDNAGAAFTVTTVWCRCQKPGAGGCGTLAQIAFFDSNANAVLPVVTCTDEGVALDKKAVTSGGSIVAGRALIFSVNNTPSADMNYLICATRTAP